MVAVSTALAAIPVAVMFVVLAVLVGWAVYSARRPARWEKKDGAWVAVTSLRSISGELKPIPCPRCGYYDLDPLGDEDRLRQCRECWLRGKLTTHFRPLLLLTTISLFGTVRRLRFVPTPQQPDSQMLKCPRCGKERRVAADRAPTETTTCPSCGLQRAIQEFLDAHSAQGEPRD